MSGPLPCTDARGWEAGRAWSCRPCAWPLHSPTPLWCRPRSRPMHARGRPRPPPKASCKIVSVVVGGVEWARRARAEHHAAGERHLERYFRPGRVVRAGAGGALQVIGSGRTCRVQARSACSFAEHVASWRGAGRMPLTRARRPQFLADFGHVVLARGGRAACCLSCPRGGACSFSLAPAPPGWPAQSPTCLSPACRERAAMRQQQCGLP
jgi:hypothetical protein